ncbi:AGE family epimerase/isomerase [Clostridium estertheticum]|uniref:Cellobiose 2-epimerase n=1 Tax=Clostridium estertheticum subsp. estertheticum TaxID=1552 RepID=A0A1J0GEF4_9CLOT|nr:AGE family epimerase/isomerase [Clostridium estertheticum]APC39748.1 N-acylglucosamine 2-epimerase [Clostridium estertheticum subsp. estertheticum]MBU3172092.1 AGE family epimerase/isomerase [Clostridium estertheticum]MBZ9614207.1 AGE family epimerase/isomerase [Clostridium estertheticum subsp. laramiense]WAG74152.1 AGE family epimerase/isomerase [Clostridium estertheticum]
MLDLLKEVKKELDERIFPFWSNLADYENGGFYGYVGYEGIINKNSEKGVILNTRILWFFSAIYCLQKKPEALRLANHAYEFMETKLFDDEYEGLYWMVDFKGVPTDNRKHIYNQAFGIYGLCQYYKATGKEEVLNKAKKLFALIENKCENSNGYLEEFDRLWNEKENEMLSENNVISDRTMNTHLHILEAYTLLYEVSKDNNVAKRLYYILDLIKNKIYSPKKHSLKVFFDKDWSETVDIQSYGHDIEGSWLIDRAAEILEDKKLIESTHEYTLEIAENIYKNAYSTLGVINETVDGITDAGRVWWVQAETIVGFYNAYEKTKDIKYLNAANDLCKYIKKFVVDKKENSEWYWKLAKDNSPIINMPIVEPWKCPYHNGRMCIEIIERMWKSHEEEIS